MKAACPRLFEVEALRDGRLTGAEVVRFQSHLGACSVCAREARALQALALALRSSAPVADADELHIRRERTRLLSAFDASLVPPLRERPIGSAPGWLRPVASAAALGLLACLAFLIWPAHTVPSRPAEPAVAPVALAPEAVTIRANGAARWSRRVEARLERIVLESGTLSIHVDHTVSEQGVLVVLPDGELEDIGTTFAVSADAGHTTQVTVQEGGVLLRLHGQPALALGAGDSWSPASSDATQLPSTPAPEPARRSARRTRSATPTLRRSAPEPDPSAEFRAAMSALDSGDNTRAASSFAAFLGAHPHDAHAEDAAYLRVLALQRAGDSTAARLAARDYLSRYPRGFRRAEVEALAR